MIRRVILAALVFLLGAAPAIAAGRYSVDRYDSRLDLLEDGALRVTETITIQFETGSFSQFYRAIPRRMNDGIEVLSASMDGTSMPIGSGPGHIEISGSSNVRVTGWAIPAPGTPSRSVPITRRMQDVCLTVGRTPPTPCAAIRIGIGGLLCKSPSTLIERICRAFAGMGTPPSMRLTNLVTRAPICSHLHSTERDAHKCEGGGERGIRPPSH